MPQRIHDVMTPHPVTLPGTASVQEAARTMEEQGIGDVIVVENQHVCGIVTDRDIVVRIVAKGCDPAATTLADICSRALTTVSPEDSLEQAVHLMRANAIRHLPVVDDGQVVGMVSLRDVAVAHDPDSVLGEISTAPPNA